MKLYRFTLPQPLRYFEVEAKSKEEAKKILEESDDITEYEFYDKEIWQPEFEYLDEG